MPKRFTAFPKTPEKKINKDLVKAQYLACSHSSWEAFCQVHNYNPARRSEFPFFQWQSEWIDQAIQNTSQAIKAFSAEKRTAHFNRTVRSLDGQLKIAEQFGYALEEMMIKFRTALKTSQFDSKALTQFISLVRTAHVIQEYEFRALFIHPANAGTFENGAPHFKTQSHTAIDGPRGISSRALHRIIDDWADKAILKNETKDKVHDHE